MCDVRSFVQRLTFSERFLKVPYANVLLYVSLFVSVMVRMLYKKFEPLYNRKIKKCISNEGLWSFLVRDDANVDFLLHSQISVKFNFNITILY